MYNHGSPQASMGQEMIGDIGGSQSHENMSPFVVMNVIMCIHQDGCQNFR